MILAVSKHRSNPKRTSKGTKALKHNVVLHPLRGVNRLTQQCVSTQTSMLFPVSIAPCEKSAELCELHEAKRNLDTKGVDSRSLSAFSHSIYGEEKEALGKSM
jgi:hypothetical protein